MPGISVTGIPIGFNKPSTAVSELDPDASAFINRAIALGETPDATRQELLNTTFINAKAKAFWDKLDALWVPAAHGPLTAKLNWLANQYPLILVNTPAFETDRGLSSAVTGNKYFYTDYSPVDNGVNFSQDSFSLGYYDRTGVIHVGFNMGCGNGPYCVLGNNTASVLGRSAFYGNDATELSGNLPAASVDGLIIGSRTASNVKKVYVNDLNQLSSTTATTGLPGGATSTKLFFGGYNNNGAIAGISDCQYALCFVGGGLSATDVADIIEVFVTGYLTSVGANV